MRERILIQEKVMLWREYDVYVPDGMTKEEFVAHLKKTDPVANNYENDGIFTIDDTDTPLEVEYYDENGNQIDSYKYEGVE
jgi:hypothetical protein